MRYIAFVAAAAALFGASQAAAANLLTNGSFEDRVVTASDLCQGSAWCVRDFASTPGWTQYSDGVDLIHNNYLQGPTVLVDASDGVNFLDMNQANSIGGLYQVVGATAGWTYDLSLDATAWATNSRGGTIGFELYDPLSATILASGSFTDAVGGTWFTQTLTAQALSGSIGVRVYGIVATQAAMGLDNVILTGSGPAAGVPEPATWAVMLLGFGAIGTTLRQRRRSRTA